MTFFDLWPLKERSDEEVIMNTFDLWFKTNKLTPQALKSVEVENWTPIWPFLTFDPWRKGRAKRSPWTLLIYGSRRTIWHLNLWNRTNLKIWPLILTPVTPYDPTHFCHPITFVVNVESLHAPKFHNNSLLRRGVESFFVKILNLTSWPLRDLWGQIEA